MKYLKGKTSGKWKRNLRKRASYKVKKCVVRKIFHVSDCSTEHDCFENQREVVEEHSKEHFLAMVFHSPLKTQKVKYNIPGFICCASVAQSKSQVFIN